MSCSGESDDEDMPQLSAHALTALQEFYQEQNLQQEESLAAQPGDASKDMPQEDWNLSQFWYDEDTAAALAKETLAVAGENGRIACISCPTLYKKLREVKPAGVKAVILEYDTRFSEFGDDFIFYDYRKPLDFSSDYEKTFDIAMVDPPFLSEECLTTMAQTVKFLTRTKILLCTGAIMEDVAQKCLGVSILDFRPGHTRNLANEFRCYANYDVLTLHS